MRAHWKENAALTTVVTLAVMIVFYGPIFGWNVIKTVYNDHQDLVTANRSMVDPKSRDEEIVALRKQVEELRTSRGRMQTAKMQDNQSRATPPLPPPIQDMRIVSQEWVPSTNPKFTYQLKVVVQTNVRIQPVSIVFICNNEIADGGVWFAGDQGVMFTMVRNGVLIANRKAYLASFDQPAFTPEKNMIVTLFSNEPIKVQSFQQVPFRSF